MRRTNNTAVSRWNVPRLLVPVDVQALVVSKASQNLTWANNPLKYVNAGTFTDVVPPMVASPLPASTGITLHWALPDGLTQGIENETGEIEYPYVPNRWMVTRFWNGQSKSWILQSDFLDKKTGENQFLDPNRPAEAVYTRIGKAWELAAWPGESGVTQERFLRAVGPGTTTFAAYVAGIKSVFSFYDSMADLSSLSVKVTYLVAGWYANPEDDPMLGVSLFGPAGFQTFDQWKLVMDRLRWSVGTDTDIEQAVNDYKAWATLHHVSFDPNVPRDVLPSQTLCQGMVYGVNWLGANGKLQSGVPQYVPGTPLRELPMIAVGNTSVDALAALVEYELNLDNGKDGVKAAEFLEAFQYHQLNSYEKQGGQTELYAEIFKAWFGSDDGQAVWYIRDPENPDPPVLSPEVQADLLSLNGQEAEVSIARRMLRDAQQYLFGLWWKQGKANTYDFPGEYPAGISSQAEWDAIKQNINDAIDPAKTAVTDYQAQVESLTASIAVLVDNIRTALHGSPLVLEENTGARYWHGNDPVILVYGAQRSYRHGEDGRFSEEGTLFTRFTGQTVFAIDVEIPGYTPPRVSPENISIPLIPGLNENFPPEMNDLSVETFFLDTGNAEAIAKEAAVLLNIPFDPSYTQIVITQQTSGWNAQMYKINPQVMANVSGIVGTLPSKVAVDPWQAPWSPLYLSWEIEWFPSYELPKEALQRWTFDETNYEYKWNVSYDPSGGASVTFSGNTLLTPKSAFTLAAELDAYLDETGEQPALREFLETTSNWDFLSQSLSGFSDMLLGLSANQLNLPPADIRILTGNETQLSPVPEMESARFFPMRAGHFRLRKIWVVDDFGQVFDPIAARSEQPSAFQPALGTGMKTETDKTLVQLPPRITQSSRLLFEFLPQNGNVHYDPADTSVNPVCGWLLPNHLDHSLMIYADNGDVLGEMILTGTTGNLSLRFDYAPGENIPVGTPLREVVTNEFLRGFIEGVFAQSNPAAAFIALLEVIDETLWTVNPLGGRNNELTAVLIGRPLALLRAGLKYELSGGPQYNQKWTESGLKISEEYETISLPVQVGNTLDPQDGTIGYFLGSDFTRFSSLLKNQAPANPYIVNERVPLDPSSAMQDLTLIVDPRGSLNTISGILPLNQLVVPAVFVEDPLSAMDVTFRTGPLLVDPDQLRMPLPTEMTGAWSWIQHSGVTTWETIETIGQANQQARFPQSLVMRDGWLQLSGAFKPDSGE